MTKIKLTDLTIHHMVYDFGQISDEDYIRVSSSFIPGSNAFVSPSDCYIDLEDITPKHQMQRYLLIIFLLECIVKDQWRNRNVVIIAKKDSDGIPFIEEGIEKYAVYIEFNGIHSWFKIPTVIMEKYGKKLLMSFEQELAPKWDGVHTSTETLLEFLAI